MKKNLLLTLFAIVALACYFGLAWKKSPCNHQSDKIRSIGETQQQLKDAGYYHGRIDYIWGKNTERAYCEYKAAESLRLMAGKDK